MSRESFDQYKKDLDERAEEFAADEQRKEVIEEEDNKFIEGIEREGYTFTKLLSSGAKMETTNLSGDIRIEKRRGWFFVFEKLHKPKS